MRMKWRGDFRRSILRPVPSAARLLLTEFRFSLQRRETFALESTLSGRTYVGLLRQARDRGFRIHLHYLWLPNPRMAIARVLQRVKKGGHNVPVADIRRRFTRSLEHLASDYAPLADRWAVWDNQTSPPKLLAQSITCPLSQLRAILRLP
jgi:predicted ABC-type ATPase